MESLFTKATPLNTWRYANPVRLVFGDNVSDTLARIMNGQDGSSILLISYDWFKETEAYRDLEGGMEGIRSFFDIEENPSFESCQRAVDFAFTFSPEVIIAIGGGSVIDTAKAVREALAKNNRDIRALFGTPNTPKPRAMLIAAPTTHGTGSELTPWATIWDKTNKIKHSLSDPGNFPDFAFYCPALMEKLPLSIALTSTLDALSHAFEAIWNKNRNPISTHYAIKAIVLIVSHLKDLNERVPADARKRLIEASMFAGLAFSNTQTAAAHAISYPLSSYFQIPHGLACALPLYPLLKINEKSIQPELQDLFERLKVTSIDELWRRVQDGIKGRISFSLSEAGVGKDDLEWLADLSLRQSRMENNIVDLSKEDLRWILEMIF